MFKQVFTKLFRTESSSGTSKPQMDRNLTEMSMINKYEKPPIYAIPTISSCFQSSNTPSSLNNFYANENIITNNNSSHKSMSSSSSSSSSSSTSTNSFSLNFSKNSKNTSSRKFSESSTRQIYIAPHCIRYSNSTLDDTIYRIDDESLNEIAAEILESDNCPPKLQIVYYAGKYFAINNSHLQIYKQLQLSGLITHVQADVISVEAIPCALRQHLLQTPCLASSNNSNEISDEEYPDPDESCDVFEATSNSANTSSSSSSGGLACILSADILSPASIEMISKQMLVDETYEFGNCENCIESDEDENDDLGREESVVKKPSEKNNQRDQEILDNVKQDFEWKNYEKFCSNACDQTSNQSSPTSSLISSARRRQNADDLSKLKSINQSKSQKIEAELENLLSSRKNDVDSDAQEAFRKS